MTDVILTNFVSSTGVDPAVAQDILDSHEWDLEAALKSFADLKNGKLAPSPSLGALKATEAARITGRPLLQKNDAVEVAEESSGKQSFLSQKRHFVAGRWCFWFFSDWFIDLVDWLIDWF